MKVLVSAYACKPNKGSEPGIGWNWVKQISRFHEVWVITRANNKLEIDKWLEKNSLPNVKWIYFDLPRGLRFWKKGNRGVHLYYYLWQIGIYFIAKKLLKEKNIELIHHVTFGNYWMPSFLSFLPIPFVWGPIGGGESAPKAFVRAFTFKGNSYELSRLFARWVGEHDPFVWFTAKNCKVALATTNETERRLRKLNCNVTGVLSQVALSREEISSFDPNTHSFSNPFIILSIGRLLHWKGFHLGLLAFANFQKSFKQSEYWIIGTGLELRNLKKLSEKLSISDKITFWGELPREEVMQKLSGSSVLLHPSLHDSGGFVCIEAMAAGLPVICLDIGGPALIVTNDTGFKIPAHTPTQVIEDISGALTSLFANKDLRTRLGQGGQKRVQDYFSWNRKGEFINQIYKEVVNQN